MDAAGKPLNYRPVERPLGDRPPQPLSSSQYYYLFGFLALVFIILVITCAEMTIVLCYFQLCSENYHWWVDPGMHPGLLESFCLYGLDRAGMHFLRAHTWGRLQEDRGPRRKPNPNAGGGARSSPRARVRSTCMPTRSSTSSASWTSPCLSLVRPDPPRGKGSVNAVPTPTSALAGLMYFSYMLIIAAGFFLLTGSIGFIACYVFVRQIYAAVKID